METVSRGIGVEDDRGPRRVGRRLEGIEIAEVESLVAQWRGEGEPGGVVRHAHSPFFFFFPPPLGGGGGAGVAGVCFFLFFFFLVLRPGGRGGEGEGMGKASGGLYPISDHDL